MKEPNKIYDIRSKTEKNILDDVEFMNLPNWWFRIAKLLLAIIILLIFASALFVFTSCEDDYLDVNVQDPIVNTDTIIDENLNQIQL